MLAAGSDMLEKTSCCNPSEDQLMLLLLQHILGCMLISIGGCAFEAQINFFTVKTLFDWSITKKVL
jgi:hypothetical protein